MARTLALVLLLSALVLGVPEPATAQAPPSPVNEPLGDPGVDPELPRDAAEGREPRFTYFLTAQEGWTRNVVLLPESEDDTSYTDRLGAGARYAFRGERSDVNFRGDASWVNYRRTDVAGLDRLSFGGGIDGTYRLSPRSALSFREDYSFSSTDPGEILQADGLPVPAQRSRRNRASVGLSAGLGARTGLNLGVRQASVSFDEGGVGEEQLLNTNTVTFAASLSRRIGADDSVTLGGSYQRRIKPEIAPDLQTGFLGWTGRLSRRVTAGLTAGVTRVSATEIFPVLWEPYGSARVTMEFRRGSIAMVVARVVNQAFAFGTPRKVDRASIIGTRYFGRRFTGSATGTYSRSRSLQADGRVDVDTWSAGGRLGYLASRHLDVAVSYNHAFTNPLGPVPGYRFERATVSLTYGSARQ